MLILNLPPELEQAVQEQARQQGTTPELLACDVLRQRLLPVPVASVSADGEGQSMADFLGDFVGCLDSRELVPDSANLDRKLAEIAALASSEELAKLPADLSDQLDHYIYGIPKR